MGANDIRYSVLMAVYIKDDPRWFDLAVSCMIQQTVPPTEIVIVKDGLLTDELEDVLSQKICEYPNLFHIVALAQNEGLGEALRVGVLECKCEWIVRMDSDDYAVPTRCEVQFDLLVKYDLDIISSNIVEFVDTIDNVVASRVFPQKHEALYKFAKHRTPFAHPAVIMKKSQVIQAGNYKSAYLHEDFDLFIRLLQLGCKAYTVQDALVYMRVNKDFYARRGGLKYLKALLTFNIKQYKRGWMSLSDFVLRSSANIVACLLPNGFRSFFYKTFLRK